MIKAYSATSCTCSMPTIHGECMALNNYCRLKIIGIMYYEITLVCC